MSSPLVIFAVGVQWNSVCQELDQSAARHYRQVRLLCELPSDQQDNRPAEHVRNWQFWDREGAAPNGGVRVVE